MRFFNLSFLLILILLVTSCGGGGGGPMIISEIQGPTEVTEQTEATYSIEAAGDTGITYAWAVDPASAGTIPDPTLASISFSASDVDSDIPATVRVTVVSDNNGPIVKTLDILITEDLTLDPHDLQVGEIDGPVSVYEITTEYYSISATGDTDITYLWSIDPELVGDIPNPTLETIRLNLFGVSNDTSAQVQIVVNSENAGPVTRTLDITILDGLPCNLTVGDITGSTEMDEYENQDYSVEATSNSEITYLWTCDPVDGGSFDDPELQSPEFMAYGVDAGTQVELKVVVNSDNCDPVERTLAVTVQDVMDASNYLGEGHPIEGINPRRNSRSTHLLPTSLQGYETMPVPQPPNEYDGSVNLNGFVVSGDERLYVSANSIWGFYGIYEEHFEDTSLAAIYFGDPIYGYPSIWEQGGKETVLTSTGAYSIDYRYESWGYNMTPGTGGGSITIDLRRYSSWPAVQASVMSWKSWDSLYGEVYGYTYHGAKKMFYDIFPLPDNRSVGAWYRSEGYLDFLDENLESIRINTLDTGCYGLAFDGSTRTTYAAVGTDLCAYDWDGNLKWTSNSTDVDYSSGYPVIDDEGGILGVKGGIMYRINPDGSFSSSTTHGANSRPFLLNDGTICVLSNDQFMRMYDTDLNMLGYISIPVTTGWFTSHTPIVDANDNILLYAKYHLYIIDRYGNPITDFALSNIKYVRLGPNHLFVIAGNKIYRFPV